MADSTLINGDVHNWTSVRIKKNGQSWSGVTAINWSQKRERAMLYGAAKHGAPRGRTSGKYSVDSASMKMAKGSAAIFKKELAQQAPDQKSFGNVEFDITVQFIASGEQAITVELQRCVITGTSSTNEESSTDALVEEFTLSVMRVVEDGLTLYDATITRSV
jgi:hypothetical protein